MLEAIPIQQDDVPEHASPLFDLYRARGVWKQLRGIKQRLTRLLIRLDGQL